MTINGILELSGSLMTICSAGATNGGSFNGFGSEAGRFGIANSSAPKELFDAAKMMSEPIATKSIAVKPKLPPLPEAISATIAVPLAEPSLIQSSSPLTPSLAVK
ncbi:MAG: hypothetical protein R3C05_08690 [Pirellulaceae bacterium]